MHTTQYHNLYIVATPIGNLQDITIRAIKTLFEVDYIYSEQPSKTSILLKRLKGDYPELMSPGKNPKVISFNEFEEESRIYDVLRLLQEYSVALVSEAGTPLLSDPGYKLVREAWKKGIRVIPIPGPSSILAALSISPLPTDKFTFIGFPPKSEGKKTHFFEKLKSTLEDAQTNDFSSTIVMFESPHRLIETLTIMNTIFGNMEIVLAKELTKIYENLEKEPVNKIIELLSLKPPKGEYIILFNLKQ